MRFTSGLPYSLRSLAQPLRSLASHPPSSHAHPNLLRSKAATGPGRSSRKCVATSTPSTLWWSRRSSTSETPRAGATKDTEGRGRSLGCVDRVGAAAVVRASVIAVVRARAVAVALSPTLGHQGGGDRLKTCLPSKWPQRRRRGSGSPCPTPSSKAPWVFSTRPRTNCDFFKATF